MNMTQSQLVKELRNGPPVHTHPGDRELRLTPRSAIFVRNIMADAATLIEKLAADRASAMQDISDSLKEINELQACPTRWINVVESLPAGEVLAANFAPRTYGYKEYIIGHVLAPKPTQPGGYYAENEHEILHDVTHWMPLPEPPKE